MKRLYALVLVSLLLAGCREDVTAVLGTNNAFTLYGVLTPETDTQWVRVFPIQERLEPIPADPLDATVTSTDLQTGTVRTWHDSTLTEPDGQYTHVFWSPFRARRGHTYRLHVENDAGNTARVDAAVPPSVSLDLGPTVTEENPSDTWLPVTIPVRAEGAPRLHDIRLTYRVKIGPGLVSPGNTRSFTYPLDNWAERVNGAWEVGINLRFGYDRIHAELQHLRRYNADYGIAILDLALHLLVVNEEWDPPEDASPEVMAHPFVLHNVENGFGFVGAGYKLGKTWTPSEEAFAASRFRRPDTTEPAP